MAVASPIAHERRSSGTSRANAAMTIVNEPPVSPRPTSTPALSASAVPVVLDAHQRDADARRRAPPAASTRAGP